MYIEISMKKIKKITTTDTINYRKTLLPLRWAGGKYYALKKLSQFWERFEHDEYREPFLGGGSVFWAKPKVKYNWLNDIDRDLIQTLRFIKNPTNRSRLLKFFEKEKEATKEKYSEIKKLVPKNELERVYKYYYLNRTSFSGKMRNPSWGYRPKRSLPPDRWKERIEPCGIKLSNTKLTSIDFEKVMMKEASSKKVLMFLDPPYFHTRQESHYSYPFDYHDHERLATICRNTPHSFFLTYDDCPEIRKLYNWANIFDLQFYYRLDNSKNNGNKRKIGSELVITNYELNNINRQLLQHATVNV